LAYSYRYIRCTFGYFSRDIAIHKVMYGANIRFWPIQYLWSDNRIQPCSCTIERKGETYAGGEYHTSNIEKYTSFVWHILRISYTVFALDSIFWRHWPCYHCQLSVLLTTLILCVLICRKCDQPEGLFLSKQLGGRVLRERLTLIL
jgi:hypothetical protein